MAVNLFPAAAGGILPIGALEKVHEGYSSDGFFRYAPEGGLPAGKYAIEARGSDIDYLEVTAPGSSLNGKTNIAYIEAAAGKELVATAGTFGDRNVVTNSQAVPLPVFSMSTVGSYIYSLSTGDVYTKSNGNYFGAYGVQSSFRVATSQNGSSWNVYGNFGLNGWGHLGDTAQQYQIADVQVIGNYLYALHVPFNGSGFYRTADLTGNTGWSKLSTDSGFNIFGSPVSGSNRIFYFGNGFVRYSDNFGSSWTAVSGGAPSASWSYYSPVAKGNDIYAIASYAFSSGGTLSYIVRSTDNGLTWSTVHTFPNSNSWPISLTYSPALDRFVVATRDSLGNGRLWLQWSDNNCTSFNNSNYAETDTSELGYSKVAWFAPANKFVASVKTTGQIWESVNGSTWTFRTNPPGSGMAVFAVRGNELIYRSYDEAGALGRTTDLVNFNHATISFTATGAVAYAGSNFVVTASNSNVYLRGASLGSLEPFTGPANLRQIVGGNGSFLAKSTVNEGFYSLDGLTWTNTGVNSMVTAPAFVDGKFIRIDTSLRLWTSTDAVSWTQRGVIPYAYPRIKKIRNLYFAYGAVDSTSGYAMSPDLVTWTRVGNGNIGQYLLDVEYSEKDDYFYIHEGTGSGVFSKALGEFVPSATSNYRTSVYIGIIQSNAMFAATTSTIYRAEAANGVVFSINGFLYEGQDWSTNGLDLLRFMQVKNNNVIQPYTSSLIHQAGRGGGSVLTVTDGGNLIAKLNYGKPAYFAVYKIKE